MQNAGYDRGSDLSAELGALEYLYVDQGSNKTVAMALCGMWGHYLGVNVTPRAVTPAEAGLRYAQRELHAGRYVRQRRVQRCGMFPDGLDHRQSDNFLHYENSAYDTLMSIIAGAEDGSARMGCLHDAEDLLLEIDCAISPLYTVGTAWKLRDTYLGAIRDPGAGSTSGACIPSPSPCSNSNRTNGIRRDRNEMQNNAAVFGRSSRKRLRFYVPNSCGQLSYGFA